MPNKPSYETPRISSDFVNAEAVAAAVVKALEEFTGLQGLTVDKSNQPWDARSITIEIGRKLIDVRISVENISA